MENLTKIQNSHNKNINVIIGDGVRSADLELFGGEDVLFYPIGTKIRRILVDTKLAKSTSEVNGTQWKNYDIPMGFTDLYLDGLSIRKNDFWGKRPHRLTILRLE